MLVVDRWRISEVSLGLDCVDTSTYFRVEDDGADAGLIQGMHATADD